MYFVAHLLSLHRLRKISFFCVLWSKRTASLLIYKQRPYKSDSCREHFFSSGSKAIPKHNTGGSAKCPCGLLRAWYYVILRCYSPYVAFVSPCLGARPYDPSQSLRHMYQKCHTYFKAAPIPSTCQMMFSCRKWFKRLLQFQFEF